MHYPRRMAWEVQSDLDRVSRRAYGKTHTLRLMMFILESPDGIVSQQYLEEATRISAGTINKTLSELTSLRLIQRLDTIGTRVINYQILDGPGWHWAKELSTGLWPEGDRPYPPGRRTSDDRRHDA